MNEYSETGYRGMNLDDQARTFMEDKDKSNVK